MLALALRRQLSRINRGLVAEEHKRRCEGEVRFKRASSRGEQARKRKEHGNANRTNLPRVTHSFSVRLRGAKRRVRLPSRLQPPSGRIAGAYFLYVLIRQGLRGGSGPQRLTRALGIETGNPIMTFETGNPIDWCLLFVSIRQGSDYLLPDDWDVYYERGRKPK